MKKENFRSWSRYGESDDLTTLTAFLFDFLRQNKTEREIVRSTVSALKKLGARPAEEIDAARPGDIVYMNWKNRSIAAARIGTQPVSEGINAIISHGDAPRIDVKERPLYDDKNLFFFDCHYYGGIKKYQWVNIPLALHGEIHDGKGGIAPLILGESESDPVFMIPDLAIHMEADMTARTAKAAVDGENLDILAGSVIKDPGKDGELIDQIKAVLHSRWGLDDRALASADLALVPAGPARSLGFDSSLITSYALDDHICTAASWSAFLECPAIPERTVVHMVMDKEEIGSDGIAGADGALFETFLLELLRLQEGTCSELLLRRAASASVAVSADVTCGTNPLYAENYVRDQQPLCGDGPVIMKTSGSGGKYEASEARGEMMAAVIRILEEENIPWQVGSFGRIDKAGGGTLGKYIARLGVDIIDIGPALLSMHAPMEIGSKADFVSLQKCYKAFFTKMKAL